MLISILLSLIGAGEVLAFLFGRIGATGFVIASHAGAGLSLFALVTTVAIEAVS